MSNSQTSNAVVFDLPEAELPARPRTRPSPLRLVEEPATISLADESALSWYFGQGLSIYDRSTFGAVLQRITLDGFSSGECEKCHGEGILNDGGFSMSRRCKRCAGIGTAGEHNKLCDECQGSGLVAPYEVKAEHGGWCDSCNGSGSTSMNRHGKGRMNKCPACGGAKWSKLRAECSVCLGDGTVAITASPMTVPNSSSGVMPDDTALTRFAVTSRRLAWVNDSSAASFTGLQCYYGDVGARWARHEFGRIFGLYALTPCGRKLARWGEGKKVKTAKKAGADGAALKPAEEPCQTDQERIGVQAVLEKTQPKRERTVLLLGASAQARDLYARSVEHWNRAQPTRADAALQRLSKRFWRAGLVNAATHLAIDAQGR